MLSGEEEVEVKGELDEDKLPSVWKQKGHKGRGDKGPPAQPMHQSTQLQKPSVTIQRIQAGEGMTGEDLMDLADCDVSELEWCKCANLVGYEEAIAMTIQEAEGDPKTMQEAWARNDWPSWKEVMDCKIGSLEQAKTWTTVLHPTRKNVVGCKWVFRLKRKADGSIDKYKAHLVVRGFTQIYGIDYYNTYSLVACLASFRLILAIAAQNNWEVEVFDFNSAYLNGKLNIDEEIYMQELPGYEIETGDRVKKLLKAL
jgi:Reverse transcriptase (RNA-dependent DNA polymerase)